MTLPRKHWRRTADEHRLERIRRIPTIKPGLQLAVTKRHMISDTTAPPAEGLREKARPQPPGAGWTAVRRRYSTRPVGKETARATLLDAQLTEKLVEVRDRQCQARGCGGRSLRRGNHGDCRDGRHRSPEQGQNRDHAVQHVASLIERHRVQDQAALVQLCDRPVQPVSQVDDGRARHGVRLDAEGEQQHTAGTAILDRSGAASQRESSRRSYPHWTRIGQSRPSGCPAGCRCSPPVPAAVGRRTAPGPPSPGRPTNPAAPAPRSCRRAGRSASSAETAAGQGRSR